MNHSAERPGTSAEEGDGELQPFIPRSEGQGSSPSSPLKDCQKNSKGGCDNHVQLKAPTVEFDMEEGDCGPQCRICLETGGDDLIAPCRCKGTQQFVHRACLDHWRSVKEGFAFAHCTECKAQYHLEVASDEEQVWRHVKFRFFVTRDILLVFLGVQLGIALLGALVALLDRDHALMHYFEWQKKDGPPGPINLDKHPAAFYYCTGVVLFFAFVGGGGLLHLICNACENGTEEACGNTGVCDCCDCTTTCIYCSQTDIPCVECASAGGDAIPCLAAGAGIIIIIFAVIGVVYGFLMATVVAQRIWQRHYHVLTKHVLSQEFIVVDLKGKPYEPPTLMPEHQQHLTALGLL